MKMERIFVNQILNAAKSLRIRYVGFLKCRITLEFVSLNNKFKKPYIYLKTTATYI